MPYTVPAIVKQVNSRTENKATGRGVNLNMEFFFALDEMVIQEHYWWRKRFTTFTTVVGENYYDLSNGNGTIATPAATDLQEIEGIYPIGQCQGWNGDRDRGLSVITSDAEQAMAMVSTTQGPPCSYFIPLEPDSTQAIQLAQPANQATQMGVVYWAVSAVSDPDGVTEIPLIPGFLQWGLAYGLEARIYEILYGQNDSRFQMANARKEQWYDVAARTKDWNTGAVIEARTGMHGVQASTGYSSHRGR